MKQQEQRVRLCTWMNVLWERAAQRQQQQRHREWVGVDEGRRSVGRSIRTRRRVDISTYTTGAPASQI